MVGRRQRTGQGMLTCAPCQRATRTLWSRLVVRLFARIFCLLRAPGREKHSYVSRYRSQSMVDEVSAPVREC